MGPRIQNRWCGRPLRCAGVVPWSSGPVAPSGHVPRPQPGLDHGSQNPDSVARETPSVCPRGPVVPWSRGPVWPPSGPRLAPVYTHTHTLTHSHSHSHTHTLTHSHTHTLAHSHIHTLIHSETHTLLHSRTHALTHSLSQETLFGAHAPVSKPYAPAAAIEI